MQFDANRNRPDGSRQALARGLVAIACLALASCGDDQPKSSRELLARPPDLAFEDLGVVSPDPERQWGRLGGDGWHGWTGQRAGRAYVVNHSPTARLSLPATGPGERELSFDAWIALEEGARDADEREARVQARLNGTDLDELVVGSEPATFTLAVPDDLWIAGLNDLELESEVALFRKGALGLALSEVRCGSEQRRTTYDPEARTVRLEPRTGLRYTVEAPGRSSLQLAGSSTGAGTLEVSFTLFDPLTDRPVESDTPPFRVPVAKDRLAAELPVPSVPGMVVMVDLTWQPEATESESVATLEALRVLDDHWIERPPVVLVSIDTLAARHMSLYGYERKTTPNIEEFARDATVFERCGTNAPWTSPSYVSLFTGLFPSSVSMNLAERESRFMFSLPAGRWTLAEALRANGYRTAGYVDAIHIGERFGYGQGFEVFDHSAGSIGLEDPTGGLDHILPLALDWLDSVGDQSAFLFLHTYDVHGPYHCTEPFDGMFESDELSQRTAEMAGGTLLQTFNSIPDSLAVARYPEDAIPDRVPSAPFIADYDEGIAALDASFGELVEELRERGVLERAIVIVTADHGESTDDHRYFGHGLLYEEVRHVPLIVRLPAMWRDRWSPPARVKDDVQLVDLYPTLLELVGLTSSRPNLHGRSLVPLLRGESLEPTPVFAEGGIMRQSTIVHRGWKLIEVHPGVESLPWTMLTNPRLDPEWRREHVPELEDHPLTEARFDEILEARGRAASLKLIEELRTQLGGPFYELYHLDADPLESEDLSSARPQKVEELKRLLAAAQRRREESRRLVEESLVPLTAEDLEELGKLGYVER